MDLNRIKEYFGDHFYEKWDMRCPSAAQMLEKNERVFDFPSAMTNGGWLMFKEFIPESLRKRVATMENNATDFHADQLVSVMSCAYDTNTATIQGWLVEPDKTPVAIMGTADLMLAVNAAWLKYFQKVGATRFFINKKMCLLKNDTGERIGIIMGINYPELNK